MRHIAAWIVCVLMAVAVWSCSSTKHVPDNELLLNSVKLDIRDNREVSEEEMYNYLRQWPNHVVLGFAKLQLATYNLSGNDTTKWYNRWLRRMGQAPVIYDSMLTKASANQLRQALVNKGYLQAHVEVEKKARPEKKKMDLTYHITAGQPHTLASVAYSIKDPEIERVVMADSASMTLHPGNRFDLNALEAERIRITERLRNHGYYSFTKEYITFTADTMAGSREVDLTLTVNQPHPQRLSTTTFDPDSVDLEHIRYRIRNVIFVTDYHPEKVGNDLRFITASDTVDYDGYTVLYGPDRYLRPKALAEKCYIRPGGLFSARAVDRTYQALGQLGILKSINIEMRSAGPPVDGEEWLDAYVLLTRGKKQGVTIEVEGTNSEGDLGFGVGLTYQHRDIAKGSETFTAKFRTAYESLSGNFEGLINNRYTEYAGEVSLGIPKMQFPFLSQQLKRRMRANTEFALSFNYQERPEYTRIIAGGSWKYKWTRGSTRTATTRHQYDFLDINYVYLPQSTLDFLDQIAPTNPLLRYSYEDHFIMRSGYTFYRTNRKIPTLQVNAFAMQPSVYSLRASGEVAGNLLYLISTLSGQKKSDGAYKVFGIQYAQYIKGEIDYTYARNFNSRNQLAFHVGAGIAYPYGNSRMVPFEKRFYAGGANGVRGWGVRSLGPGCYYSRNSIEDYINQCGDIRLDLSLEYRAKLFWVFEAGLFVDAGNVWTIHNYESQPGGMFHFNSFWKQIALAYGIGLRMDFTYFLLRFDLGMKAHNPAQGQEPWPLIHPNWHRDATFHFAVGYPF